LGLAHSTRIIHPFEFGQWNDSCRARRPGRLPEVNIQASQDNALLSFDLDERKIKLESIEVQIDAL
jgi:hypothetical protein